MTCIVGLEYNGGVVIGGDVQGTGHNNKIVHTQPKVFNKRGIIFGFTTSYRFGQLLEHALPDPVIPDDPDEIYRWLITVIVPSIKSTLKDNGYDGGGNCLIGVKDQLWELQNDFSVLRSVKGYGSVGSGYEYATGCLFSKLTSLPESEITYPIARAAVQQAILAAGTFSPTVGTDSVVINTQL